MTIKIIHYYKLLHDEYLIMNQRDLIMSIHSFCFLMHDQHNKAQRHHK